MLLLPRALMDPTLPIPTPVVSGLVLAILEPPKSIKQPIYPQIPGKLQKKAPAFRVSLIPISNSAHLVRVLPVASWGIWEKFGQKAPNFVSLSHCPPRHWQHLVFISSLEPGQVFEFKEFKFFPLGMIPNPEVWRALKSLENSPSLPSCFNCSWAPFGA